MRRLILLLACLSLAACGGYRKAEREIGRSARAGVPVAGTAAAQVMRLATGPISRACVGSDRKARSQERCGCIQAVANDTLSPADQRLAVSFYTDPHRAQEIRQSDNPGHERFWQTYKDYARTAAAVCG
ncbi:hypothetical protein [Marimonas arenosa]|uniref:Arginine transporter n=1 Tax=Marimonas arenosa TaxID=1795305 RepID=A0AAE4B540_9RHOB|nr:hypothetical protein [Marimonas arenosa]MDQ2089974.1 hypothetical protein [Marimonas arenosa]